MKKNMYKVKDRLRGKFGKIKRNGYITPYTIKQDSIWQIINILNDKYCIKNLETSDTLWISESLLKIHFSKIRKLGGK